MKFQLAVKFVISFKISLYVFSKPSLVFTDESSFIKSTEGFVQHRHLSLAVSFLTDIKSH